MMFPSHLLATLLVGSAIHRVRPMSRRDWQLALGFGVVIDLDHALMFPKYVVQNGWDGVTAAQMSAWGAGWQGFMHTPESALLVVAGAALAFRSPMPLVFWALHMFQDFVIATDYVRFGSVQEWLIVAGLLTAVGVTFTREHRAARRAGSTRPFLRYAAERLGVLRPPPVSSA